MKILIAEDDLNIRLGLCDLLEDEGYTCIEASNGAEALVLVCSTSSRSGFARHYDAGVRRLCRLQKDPTAG